MFPLSLLSLPAASQRAAAHLWGKLGKTDEGGVKTQGGEGGRKERLPLGKFSPLIREEGEKEKGEKNSRTEDERERFQRVPENLKTEQNKKL